MPFPDRRTVDILLTTLLFLGICALLYSARRVILVFVAAILFSYLINPIVTLLERHSLLFRNLRGPAVAEVYLLLLILIAVPTQTLVPALLRQGSTLLDTAPALLVGQSTEGFVKEVGDRYGWTEAQELRLTAFLETHREDVQGFTHRVEHQLPTAAQAIGYFFVIPILAIFFLHEGANIANTFILFAFSPDRSEVVHHLAEELDATLKKYIRAKVILGSLSLVVYAATMLLFRVPHAVTLGICGGLLDCVPVAGGVVAVAGIVIVGALSHSHWIWMAPSLIVWRIVQDYIVAPRILGHNLEIHPLMAIFGVMAGWDIGGVVGIYFALPLMAAAAVILRWYVSSRSLALSDTIHQR